MNTINNGNMYQKSLIQQINEFNEAKGLYKKSLSDILEHYDASGCVFALSNGRVIDIKNGYFVTEFIYTDLNEAIKDLNDLTKCIRVVSDNLFQVGYVVESLTNIKEGVIDIASQTEIF